MLTQYLNVKTNAVFIDSVRSIIMHQTYLDLYKSIWKRLLQLSLIEISINKYYISREVPLRLLCLTIFFFLTILKP